MWSHRRSLTDVFHIGTRTHSYNRSLNVKESILICQFPVQDRKLTKETNNTIFIVLLNTSNLKTIIILHFCVCVFVLHCGSCNSVLSHNISHQSFNKTMQVFVQPGNAWSWWCILLFLLLPSWLQEFVGGFYSNVKKSFEYTLSYSTWMHFHTRASLFIFVPLRLSLAVFAHTVSLQRCLSYSLRCLLSVFVLLSALCTLFVFIVWACVASWWSLLHNMAL